MSRDEIDHAYDGSTVFPDVPQWRTRWLERNAALTLSPAVQLDVAYGSEERQKVDIFPVGDPNAPTLLFFHGGFWSRNGKETFHFLIDAFHRAGFNAVFANYRLAPVADFGMIVADALQVSRWLAQNLQALGFAERKLGVVGWSSGAHLAVLLEESPVVGAILGISGIYDLEPMRISSMNDLLGLDEEAVAHHSPTRLQPGVAANVAPTTIAYGGRELREFQLQSHDFYEARRSQGCNVVVMPIDDHHHHSVLEALYEPAGVLNPVLVQMRAFIR
ncbi:arylformamidase [Caballeronia udeis]|uniref:Arylformamidase n=1 Tax=Caballeronia udeis TaxID=1232866 RepID=A0ABW8MQQ7_9BURK